MRTIKGWVVVDKDGPVTDNQGSGFLFYRKRTEAAQDLYEDLDEEIQRATIVIETRKKK